MIRLVIAITALLCLAAVSFSPNAMAASGQAPVTKRTVAHAGGGINGMTYTNSLEALDKSYSSGFRLMEVDFEWTLDGELVLLHDWNGAFKALFSRPAKGRLALSEFLALEMNGGLTQLSLQGLIRWLRTHDGVRILTDVKHDNIGALKKIAGSYPEYAERIMPQVYHPLEYKEAKRLGYKDIIFTLYRSELSDAEVVDFARANTLYGVTMPKERAFANELPRILAEEGVFVYAHTINDQVVKEALLLNSVDGIYSESITPIEFEDKPTIQGSCAIRLGAGKEHRVGYLDVLKRGPGPLAKGRAYLEGCSSLIGESLVFDVIAEDGESLGKAQLEFPMIKGSDGAYFADYEIPLATYIIESPSRSFKVRFDMKRGEGYAVGPLYGDGFGYGMLEVSSALGVGLLLKLRLYSVPLMMLTLFAVPLVCFILILRIKSPFREISYGAPVAYLASMEIYSGFSVNGFPLHGTVISVSAFALLMLAVFVFAKGRAMRAILSSAVIASLSIYFLCFEVYRNFFKDYPSIEMTAHSGQLIAILDSISSLIGTSELFGAALALVYLIVVVWNEKYARDLENRLHSA